jgi:hypothetical protein
MSSQRPRLISLKLALLVAVVLAVRISWFINRAEGWDTPALLPLLLLAELPLAVALVLITRTGNDKLVQVGAGIAFGTDLTFTICAPFLYLAAGLEQIGGRRPILHALANYLGIAFLVGVWLAVSAWKAKRDLRKFSLASGAAVAYFIFAYFLAGLTIVPGNGAIKGKGSHVVPLNSAGSTIGALTACLIRHKFLHPEDGFPGSLGQIPSGWNCDMKLTNPASIPEYWVFYSPVKDPLTGRMSDFRIQAVPIVRAEEAVGSPIVSDGRGEILAYWGWGWTRSQRASQEAYYIQSDFDFTDFQWACVDHISRSTRNFMKKHDLVRAPDSIQEALADDDSPNICSHAGETSKEEWTHTRYAIQYSPSSDVPSSFAISATCREYGSRCIRSYYQDFDGTIHGTPEPRPATAQDPPVSSCELDSPCKDGVWPLSAEPSESMRFRANLLYWLHTVNLF